MFLSSPGHYDPASFRQEQEDIDKKSREPEVHGYI
jgi:hypothetical protein